MDIFKAIFCMIYLRLSCGIRLTLPAIPRHYGQKIEAEYTAYRYKPTSVYVCAQLCVSFRFCAYFNFNLEQMLCEIMFRGSPFAATKKDFYVKASDIKKEYAGSCANHSCTHDEVCVSKTSDSYDCLRLIADEMAGPSTRPDIGKILADLNLTHAIANFQQEKIDIDTVFRLSEQQIIRLDINCHKPSNVANAHMIGEGTLLYSQRTIICNDETVPIPSDCQYGPCTDQVPSWYIERLRICLPNSKWLIPIMTCKRCFNDPHEMWTQMSRTLTGRTCLPWSNSDKFKNATFYQSSALNAENFCRSPKTGTTMDDRPYLWCQTDDPLMSVDVCPIPRCYGTDVGSFDSQFPGLPINMYKFTLNFADVPVTHFTCTNFNSTLSYDNCPVSRYENERWTTAYLSCSDQECFTSGKNYTGKMTCTVSGRTCQVWNSKTPHDHTYVLPDPEDNNSNYCRHPDGTDKVPWCFTTDPLVRYEHCWVPVC